MSAITIAVVGVEVETKKPLPGVSRVTVSYEQVGEFKNQDCRMMRTVFVIDLRVLM